MGGIVRKVEEAAKLISGLQLNDGKIYESCVGITNKTGCQKSVAANRGLVAAEKRFDCARRQLQALKRSFEV